MSTRVSRSIAGSGISPYFGVDTHRSHHGHGSSLVTASVLVWPS